MKFISTYLPNLLKNFGYADIFDTKIENGGYNPDAPWIKEFNARNLKLSITNLYTSNEVTSIMINFPQLLLRKKSTLWPNGRTSYRFKG